ncbi:MAG: hypothetical protein ACXWBQ_14125 [Usitatibacter sp.]
MRAALAAIALLLAGCAVPRPDATAPAPVETPAAAIAGRTQADEIVAYLARLRGMSETALGAEAARRRREASDLAHVKAALALSLTAQADEAEVIALVEPLAKKDNGDRDVKAVAGFLQAIMMERRRLKESAVAAGARLREERRGAEAQKQRADALQQKLDALTDLEKSLSDRPSPNR